MDDDYEFVHVAWCLYRRTGRVAFLQEKVKDRTLWQRLTAAFQAPDTDGKTGMVTTDADRRAVGFGFCDGIYLTGRLLFPPLGGPEAGGLTRSQRG